MKKQLICLLLFSSMLGCSLFGKKESVPEIKYPPELEEVQNLIMRKKTDDARIQVDDYVKRSENIHWFGHAYFLKGYLYEMDENYKMAEKFYREAIQHSANYNSRVQAKALYNLSFVYEKTNQREKLLGTLLDLMKRQRFFGSLTGQVEIPARLAAIYAARGEVDQAIEFHARAKTKFETMVRVASFNEPKEEISKSLYYLGLNIFDDPNENFKNWKIKTDAGQKYLLGSAEASDGVWSKKSADRLLEVYDIGWSLVNTYKPEGRFDSKAMVKQQHEGQLVMASNMYDLIHQIRAEEFPMSNVNNRSAKIMGETKTWLNKIENFALGLNLGPDMTRNKKIKNTKLAIYIEKKEEPVKVNEEFATSKKQVIKPKKSMPAEDKKLPEKKQPDIGTDPNL